MGRRGQPLPDHPVHPGRPGRGHRTRPRLRRLPRRQPQDRRAPHRIRRAHGPRHAGHRRRRRHHQRRQPGRPAQRDLRHQRHRHQPHVASRLRKIRVPAHRHALLPGDPAQPAGRHPRRHQAATSATVNGAKAKTPTNVLAIMGDFSLIKWGMVRDITSEIIPYGDPTRPAWTSRPTTRSPTAPRPCSPTRSSNPRRSPCSRPPRKKVPDGRVHQDFIVRRRTGRSTSRPPWTCPHACGTRMAPRSLAAHQRLRTQCDERDAGGRHHRGQARRGRDPDRPEGRVCADPAGDTPTKAEYVALRDALVTAGLMRPKA